MRSALVDINTRAVANIIMADPSVDKAPPGYELVAIQDGAMVDFEWVHDAQTGFAMGPALAARVEAERIALENTPDATALREIANDPDGFLDGLEAFSG